jgi:hypothetical protein
MALALLLIGRTDVNASSRTLVGPRLIATYGGSTDTNNDEGHLNIAGLINFNGHGGASSLNVTIVYNERYDDDDFTCRLSAPSDLSFNLGPNGVGTLTLAIGPNDSCFSPALKQFAVPELKRFIPTITFRLFALPSDPQSASGRLISTSSTLVDNDGDEIVVPNTEGTLLPED